MFTTANHAKLHSKLHILHLPLRRKKNTIRHYRSISAVSGPTFANAALVFTMGTFKSLHRLVKGGTARSFWHKRKIQKKFALSRL